MKNGGKAKKPQSIESQFIKYDALGIIEQQRRSHNGETVLNITGNPKSDYAKQSAAQRENCSSDYKVKKRVAWIPQSIA